MVGESTIVVSGWPSKCALLIAWRTASIRNGFCSGVRMMSPCRAPMRRTSSSRSGLLPLITCTTPL